MRAIVALLFVLGCAAEEKPEKVEKTKTAAQLKSKQFQDRLKAADWTHPKMTFTKFFGTKGLERHSLSNKQMEQLLVEVQNKSEWKAVSMTTYWDCSSQYCVSFKNGRDALRKNSCPNVNNELFHKGPRKTDHAHERLAVFKGKDGQMFGTVAASSSLGVDDKESLGCGKCYAIRRGEDASYGGFHSEAKLTVMVTNWCPATRDAPCPAPGKIGEFGTKFHFDLAVPGGGMGTMPTCAHTYEKEDGRSYEKLKEAFNNTLHSCAMLPIKLQEGCKLYNSKIAATPLQLGLAFAEVACPPELTERFECNKPCPTCEEPLSWKQLDMIRRKEGKLTKAEQAAWVGNMSMADYTAKNHLSLREKKKSH